MISLALHSSRRYGSRQECRNSMYPGTPRPKVVDFLRPQSAWMPGAPSLFMAGRVTDKTPRKGKEVHRGYTVSNLPATIPSWWSNPCRNGVPTMKHTTNSSAHAAAWKACAFAALRSNSSLSVRLARYRVAMERARALEAQGGAQ
ncbi:hypothetical protein FQZ97_984370 [compost metagenome]